MTELFMTVLAISLSTGIIALILMILSPLVNMRYASKWRFMIWVVIALRLMIPVSGFIPRSESVKYAASPDAALPQAEVYEEAPRQVYPRIEITVPERFSEPITPANQPEISTPIPEYTPLEICSFIWLAVAFTVFSGQMIIFIIYKRRLIKRGKEIDSGEPIDIFNALKSEMNTGRGLRLFWCPKAPSPMIMGYFRPVLCLPRKDYDPEQLVFIIRHELTHFKRRDVWFKLLFTAAASVHWFNPAVWIMRRRADIDMELSVDEKVVERSDFDEKKAYTEALLSTASEQRSLPCALSTHFSGGAKVMKKRFSNILSKINRKNGILLLILVVVIVALAGALIGFSIAENPLERANSIIAEMQENNDLRLVSEIIYHELSSEFIDGEQPYPYYTERQTVDGYTDQFAAMPTPYNTKERCMEALGRVFTESACKARENCFEPGMYCDVDDDGTLWYALGEPARYLFIVPFESAEKVSGRIIAKTKFVWQDNSLTDCEIAFKKENGRWKIDGITDPGGSYVINIATPVTREDMGLPPAEIPEENAKELENIIKTASGADTVYAFEARDFDGDGTYEAFGVTGVPLESGTLWFANSGGAEAVYENEGFAVSADDGSHILDLGSTCLYAVEQGDGTVTFSTVLGVKNGKWYEDAISGRGSDIRAESAGDVTIIDASGYDAFIDPNGENSGGHTYKTYYLYYDGEGFKEYGGEEITEKEFESLGGREILDELSAGGYEIRNIIRRSNQIINLNYYFTDPDGTVENKNRTYGIADRLILIEEGDGVYETSFLPDIVVYPDGADYGPEASEVERLIENDLLITRLIDYESPEYDPNDTIEVDSQTYYHITDERFDTPEWQEFVGSVYAGGELTRASSAFVEHDGKLYCDGGSRGYDRTDRYTYTVMSRYVNGDDAGAVVRVANEYTDGTQTDFIYYRLVKLSDGWRIAQKAHEYSEVAGAAGTPDESDARKYIGYNVDKALVEISSNEEQDEIMRLSFALPEDWAYDGWSVALAGDRKVFEISSPFSIDEYDPDLFRTFPEGTSYPQSYTPDEGEFSEVTVLSEEEHDPEAGAPYVFLKKSVVTEGNSEFGISRYVVQSGDYGVYLSFFNTANIDSGEFDGICINVIRTLGISEAPDEQESTDARYTVEMSLSDVSKSGDSIEFSERNERMAVELTLPGDWEFNGYSVADMDGAKVFEIAYPFPIEEFDPEIFRLLPDGTNYPQSYTPSDGEHGEITVYYEQANEQSEGTPYIFIRNYHAEGYYGGWDAAAYVVKCGDYGVYMTFIKPEGMTDQEFDGICLDVINTLSVEESGSVADTEYQPYAAGMGVTVPELDGSGFSLSATGERVTVDYHIPKSWENAESDGEEVFDILGVFPVDMYDPQNFRRFPEGTEYPQTINAREGESMDITVLQENVPINDGRTRYECRYTQNGREYSEYIINSDGFGVWLRFLQPEESYDGFYRDCGEVTSSVRVSKSDEPKVTADEAKANNQPLPAAPAVVKPAEPVEEESDEEEYTEDFIKPDDGRYYEHMYLEYIEIGKYDAGCSKDSGINCKQISPFADGVIDYFSITDVQLDILIDKDGSKLSWKELEYGDILSVWLTHSNLNKVPVYGGLRYCRRVAKAGETLDEQVVINEDWFSNGNVNMVLRCSFDHEEDGLIYLKVKDFAYNDYAFRNHTVVIDPSKAYEIYRDRTTPSWVIGLTDDISDMTEFQVVPFNPTGVDDNNGVLTPSGEYYMRRYW